MTLALPALPETDRLMTAARLQQVVAELVALSLDAKQAHWNVVGPRFLSLHALTDELAADANRWADRAAERSVALGYSVDARPATVADIAAEFPAGRIRDEDALVELSARLGSVAGTTRAALPELERTDSVAHGIAVDILDGLERYRWLTRAQLTPPARYEPERGR